jgi:competence protein ComEC
LLNVLHENNIKEDEYAVGAALMLGYSDKLDAEILSAYSNTGALHILSVSGLHVAIVYVVFNWLLFFLDKVKHGSILKAVILILLLWFYSALTGLSPSVLRAATMFSFIIIAKSLNRHTNIYNTLAASAFLLLTINPYLIMEVGFQLSYIAVIGIVFLQPKISRFYETDNWLLDQAWSITSVSIAAQIATFPMGLFYFHQFPNYFLLSNFIVIPISTLIIYLGIALFALAKIHFIAGYLAIAFKWSVWFLNSIVKVIEKWPYAISEGISISLFETCLLYAIIIFFLLYFIRLKALFLKLGLISVIILLISQVYEQNEQFSRRRLVIYNISKTTALDFINAKNNVLFADTLFAGNASGLKFHVKNNWWDLGILKAEIVTADYRNSFIDIHDGCVLFCDKRFVIWKDSMKDLRLEKAFPIDYLILTKKSKSNVSEILKYFSPNIIIFDSSNSKNRIVKWEKECAMLNKKFYSIPDKGAFVADL